MRAAVEVTLKGNSALQLLGRTSETLKGRGPLIRQCLRTMGLQAMEFERVKFEEHSRPADTYWKELGISTLILRRHGGSKIMGESGVPAVRAVTMKLRDRNHLMDSLFPNRKGNVFRVETLSVTVGTRDPSAALHHFGGRTAPFEFDNEKQRNFKRNVSMTTSGALPDSEQYAEATGSYYEKTGRKGRKAWKKHGLPSPWNKLFFFWRAVFHKWDASGKTFSLPRRRIIVPLDKNVLGRMAQTVKHFIGEMWRKQV